MPGRKTTTIEQAPATEQEKQKKSRRANGEGSPRTRSDGRFEVRVSLPDGTRKSVYGKNRKEALAKAKELKQQIEQGTYVSPSQETVAEHLEKSSKSASSRRTILLPDFAVTALHRHRARQFEARLAATEWYDLGLVFPNRNGLHQSPSGMYKAYKRFLGRANIADATFHATRHGHATNLLEMEENPRVVQERLGHSDIATTLRIYGHVTPIMQQKAIGKLDRRYGKKDKATDAH